ncbi:MAG: calcium/sodium antiporter [Deltaproteobacteria bacterium]|nr:calcium/sodium antiporter [Deltaproteobacteria bacterium]
MPTALRAAIAEYPVWLNTVLVALTIVVIAKGADWIVEAGARVAKRLGVSELVIGLTIVAMGTSAPEFAVTLIAAYAGKNNVSVGNVVGSNIFNLGFILGGCAMVRPITTSRDLVRRDGTVLIGTAVLLTLLLGFDLTLGRLDGVVLFSLLALYLAFLFVRRAAPSDEVSELVGDDDDQPPKGWRDALHLIGGLTLVVIGSGLLVESASAVARSFGVDEWVIGVTVVAAGTSAPELATSLTAVVRGRYALSAGNVIGSDIFNMLGVLGVAGMFRPMVIDPIARESLVMMVVMVIAVIGFMRSGWRVSRLEGAALLLMSSGRWLHNVVYTARGGRLF